LKKSNFFVFSYVELADWEEKAEKLPLIFDEVMRDVLKMLFYNKLNRHHFIIKASSS